MLSRRAFAASALALGGCATTQRSGGPHAVFEPTWDSLIAGYRAPDWFRDAKFGIWAHWSGQCQPEQGDWYARRMYIQGDPAYDYHVRTHGHPSQFGFMEINNLWRAERWDPDALMQRYKRAGAKYFVALANHHDNLDNYDSRHHAWNSVNVGPKRDLIAAWAQAARRHGLRFGVSIHSSHAWWWFQTAYGYDPEGAMAGVRYDAHRLTRADGAGKWWQGLDPQQLYCGRSIVAPAGIASIDAMKEWVQQNLWIWDGGMPPDLEFARNWKLRCIDLMDSYRPDLVYFDDRAFPLGQFGLDVAAHYYNASMDWNDGRLEAVINCKIVPAERRAALVEDVERGLRQNIFAEPWQTDTCIGDWHYRRSIYEERKYKTAQWVVHALCDIVSKNGNLLLSVPVRGDGSIDSEEEKILDALTPWMQVNGDALYATRPWRIFGEGPAHQQGGMFSEGSYAFTGEHIRFTQKNGDLYALVLGWPQGAIARIASLSTSGAAAAHSVERIDLLGAGQLQFERNADSLRVRLPDSRSGEIAHALRIRGRGLV